MAREPKNFGTGLVLGKFYPLTKGHQHLIETARSRCRTLYVAVGSRPSETIPPDVRAGWIRQLYPDARVIVQPNTLPYFPEECSTPHEFYTIWTKALQEVCDGRSPDALFTSEDYGDVTARYLGCVHVMVDRSRTHVPICGTKVRESPFDCWAYLDPVVQRHFTKTVSVIGPESTGKSTLCEQLARRFNTVWQPEWARDYLGERHCEYEDMEIIARGHFGEHPGYKARADKILFMDTDAITTLAFSEHYFGLAPQYVHDMAGRMHEYVDLYLFTDIDVPWVPDTSRDLGAPEQRQTMRRSLLAHLERRDLPYLLIAGDWGDRFRLAVKAVEERFLRRAADDIEGNDLGR
jgi:HTH-type transcriptional repressor of NAD biosynthesis genes